MKTFFLNQGNLSTEDSSTSRSNSEMDAANDPPPSDNSPIRKKDLSEVLCSVEKDIFDKLTTI